MITLTLPLSPSINHYFARHGSRTYLPQKVRDYRKQVAEIVAAEGVETLTGRLSVFVAVHPASKRRCDLDNRLKGLQDALQCAGVFEDDEQIDSLHVVRKGIERGGKIVVVITENEG